MDNFFYTYADFVKKYADIAKQYENQGLQKNKNVLYIPKNTVVKDPLTVADIDKCTIVLGALSSAKVIDSQISLNSQERTRDIFVASNAQLVYVDDQHLEKTAQQESTVCLNVKKDSSVSYYAVHTGGLSVSTTISCLLQEVGAEISVEGVSLLSEKQKNSFYTLQHHKQGQTTSRLQIKSCLAGAAHSFYKGSIIIDKKAKNADASQKNKVLLLSDQSKAESIPCLEVLESDVTCAHGSAIGYLNKDELYYLQSRGIEKKQAEKMLIRGFVKSFLQTIQDKTLKSFIYNRIEKKLQEMV